MKNADRHFTLCIGRAALASAYCLGGAGTVGAGFAVLGGVVGAVGGLAGAVGFAGDAAGFGVCASSFLIKSPVRSSPGSHQTTPASARLRSRCRPRSCATC